VAALTAASCRSARRGEVTAAVDTAPAADRQGQSDGNEAPSAEPTPPASEPKATEPPKDHAAPARRLGAMLAVRDARGGAAVERVDRGLLGADSIAPGDRIVSIDGDAVRSASALSERLAAVPDGTAVLLEILRGGHARYVGVEAPPPVPRAPATAHAAAPPPAAQRAPAAPAPAIVIVQSVPAGGAEMPPFVFGGGGAEVLGAPEPPSYSAPGLPEMPGVTFPPGPATPSQAAPQIPGVEQPPGFYVQLPSGLARTPGTTGAPEAGTAPGAPGVAGSPIRVFGELPGAAGGAAAPPQGGAFRAPVAPAAPATPSVLGAPAPRMGAVPRMGAGMSIGAGHR
jgi:hypothetical protein